MNERKATNSNARLSLRMIPAGDLDNDDDDDDDDVR